MEKKDEEEESGTVTKKLNPKKKNLFVGTKKQTAGGVSDFCAKLSEIFACNRAQMLEQLYFYSSHWSSSNCYIKENARII